MDNILAIDIGGTEIKIGIVTEDGNIKNKKNYITRLEGVSLKYRVISILKENIASDIKGIAVSTAGQVDSNTGMIIEAVGESFKGWKGTNVIDLINKEFNLPVSVENDANCAALAELKRGSAKGVKDFVLVTLGTGIGGCIVVNGNILTGSNGVAGELGHISINNEGSKCSCGNIGCWEMYGSTAALVKRGKNLVNTKEDINGKWIFENIKNGDTVINEEYNKWIYDVSLGLVTLVHLFNPSLIVIGGGVSKQGDILIKPIEEQISKLAMNSFTKNLKVVAAMHSNDAGLIGAFEHFMK